MTRVLDYELEYEEEAEVELETVHSSRAQYQVIGPLDTRVQVTDTTAAPFRYICSLEYNGRPMCSGTLIGPSTVLTAAHCLWDKTTNRRRNPTLMRVVPGRNGSLEPLPATRAASFQFAPGYRGRRDNVTPNDYAVIQLRDPIGSSIGYWSIAHNSSARDPIGTTISARPLPVQVGTLRINLSGYPGDKCINIGRPPRRVCATQQWRAYDRTVRLQGGMLHYLNDTFGGQSGCPVWVRRHPSMGGRVLVAIHVGGDDGGRTPEVANQSVRITPPILANIQRWLATSPVPPPPAVRRPSREFEYELEM